MELSTDLSSLNSPQETNIVASWDEEGDTDKYFQNLWVWFDIFFAVGESDGRPLRIELAIAKPNNVKQRWQHYELAEPKQPLIPYDSSIDYLQSVHQFSDPCYYQHDKVKTDHRCHEVYAEPSDIYLTLYYFVVLALVQYVETEHERCE